MVSQAGNDARFPWMYTAPSVGARGVEAEPWVPQIDASLQEELDARILAARLQRDTSTPMAVEAPPEALPPTDTAQVQNARVSVDVGHMQGPLTAAELWPSHDGYLFARPSLWR